MWHRINDELIDLACLTYIWTEGRREDYLICAENGDKIYSWSFDTDNERDEEFEKIATLLQKYNWMEE